MHYSPEYNILKTPGCPSRGSGWTLTAEQKVKIWAPERKAQVAERFRVYNLRKALRIQILDTVNNVTTVYLSIREAARSIGCVVPPVGTIRKAIKHLEESFHTYKEKISGNNRKFTTFTN